MNSLDTGIARSIPGSWWMWATREWGRAWTCREPSSSTACLRWVCAAAYRKKPLSAPKSMAHTAQLRAANLLPAGFRVLLIFPRTSVQVTKTPGLRPLTKEDLAGIHSLLQENRRKFHLSPILSLEEVEHWLFPKENVVDSYVVEVKFSQPGVNLKVPCYIK